MTDKVSVTIQVKDSPKLEVDVTNKVTGVNVDVSNKVGGIVSVLHDDTLVGDGNKEELGVNTDIIATKEDLSQHTSDGAIHVTEEDKETWSAKQEALTSGGNIKTINGESLLGSGNLEIKSGGSGVIMRDWSV